MPEPIHVERKWWPTLALCALFLSIPLLIFWHFNAALLDALLGGRQAHDATGYAAIIVLDAILLWLAVFGTWMGLSEHFTTFTEEGITARTLRRTVFIPWTSVTHIHALRRAERLFRIEVTGARARININALYYKNEHALLAILKKHLPPNGVWVEGAGLESQEADSNQ